MSENGRPEGEGQGEPGIGGSAAAPDKLLRTRDLLVEVLRHRIGIDTGAVFGGPLTCVVLEEDRLGFLFA